MASSLHDLVESFPSGREYLIPLLQKIQEAEGYVSKEAVRLIAKRLKISENVIFGVASFYAQFRFHPPGKHHIHVCMGTACHVRGGEQLLNTLRHRLGIKEGETTPDRKYDLNRVACLGCCALAPVVMLDGKVHSQLNVLKLRELMDEYDKIE